MVTHHAVVLVGESVAAAVDQIAHSDKSTELQILEQKNLGIDAVRSLIESAYRSPAAGYHSLCLVVGFESATVEAQNALLKLLEEPPATTRFVLSVPTKSILLPTVLSRLFVAQSTLSPSVSQLPEILSLPPKDALLLIEQRHKQKDKVWFTDQHHALIAWARAVELETIPPALREAILMALSRLNTRGVSNRWLLEHLVLAYAMHGRTT